jgi:sulfur dioxygenase
MVGYEKLRNPRLGKARTLEGFGQVIDSISLPDPNRSDWTPPGNAGRGSSPDNRPADKEWLCKIDRQR